MTDRSLTNTPDAAVREPTPEAVGAAHNPEAGRLSALAALAQAGLEDQVRAGQLLTDGDVELLSDLVHREWVQREQALLGGGRADRKSLHVPYVDLPEAQKGKDRAFVREVVASLRPEGYWGGKGSLQPYRHPLGNKTVDMIVRRTGPNTGEVEVLLIRRGEGAVEGGKWALPGGFVDSDAGPGERWRPGKETDGEAARRELREESGLDVDALEDCVRHVGHFDRHGRDPRDNAEAWAVSDAYMVDVPPEMAEQFVQGRDDADAAEWVSVHNLVGRNLAFDHRAILERAGVIRDPTRASRFPHDLGSRTPGVQG